MFTGLVTVSQAARELGISSQCVWSRVRARRVPVLRIGGYLGLIDIEAVRGEKRKYVKRSS